MNKKSQSQFANRCAILLEAGISLSEALSILLRMERNKKKRTGLKKIHAQVETGMTLSKSILTAKFIFDPTLMSMISYGESSGILPLSLRQASEIMEKRTVIKKKITGALIYPFFIALATVGMTLFLVMYIFPKIIPLLSTMNITLPLLTRMVRKLYEILVQYGFHIAGAGILSSIVFYFLYKKKIVFRYRVEIIILNMPLIGEIIKKYFITTYCRSAGTLLDCGQGLPAILSHTETASTFEPYRRAWRIARIEVERGVSVSESLRSFPSLFQTIVPDMLSIGERTGSLAAMFHNVNKMYEEELDDFIKHLSTILEPLLMIGMGLVVGSVALSIILPIYEITNHLSQ